MAEKGNLWLWIGIGGTVAAVAITAMMLMGDGCGDIYDQYSYNLAEYSIRSIEITNC